MRSCLLACLALAGCPRENTVDVNVTASSDPAGDAQRANGKLEAANSSAIERLTTEPSDDLFPMRSPGDGPVLYQAETYEGTGPNRKLVAQVLYGIDPTTKAARALFSTEGRASSHPSFTADGKTIVFVTNEKGPLAIVKSAAAPGQPSTVVVASDIAPELGEPALSLDGTRVAFSMKDKSTGARVVAIIGVDGSHLTIVGEGRAPAWAPGNERIAFIRTSDGFNHIFLASASAAPTDAKQITRGEMDCDRPSFSPDGKRIVFASNKGFKEQRRDRSAILHLFVVGADGSAITELTKGSARAATPSWAADGWIYFASDREGSFDLYRIKDP